MTMNCGKWAHELSFKRGKYIRQKCYLDEIYQERKYKGKINKKLKGKTKKNIKGFNKFLQIEITCAGMPSSCYQFVTWDNFQEGFTCGGKLTFKHVKGGVKLVETDYTIKQDKNLKNSIAKSSK